MPVYNQIRPGFINVSLRRQCTMAKSYRTCYYRNQKEFSRRGRYGLWWATSNKENKTIWHQMERAHTRAAILMELQALV